VRSQSKPPQPVLNIRARKLINSPTQQRLIQWETTKSEISLCELGLKTLCTLCLTPISIRLRRS
jgi:hypothetical protein